MVLEYCASLNGTIHSHILDLYGLIYIGMSHDGKQSGSGANSCPKQGYIMSPSRGTQGETLWSTCSANVLRKLDIPCIEEGS